MEKNNDMTWKDKKKALGFCEDKAGNRPQINHYIPKSINQFKELLGVPEGAFSPMNEAPDREQLLTLDLNNDQHKAAVKDRFVMPLALGKIPMQDDASQNAFLDNFSQGMSGEGYTGNSIDVTADHPLNINKGTSIVKFDKVSIYPGGYIEISVPCSFECKELEIKNEAAPSESNPAKTEAREYHILVTGKDGANGAAGSGSAAKGADGRDGEKGQCDCCGGVVISDGTDGNIASGGIPGALGKDGHHGENGPYVYISIDELINDLTIYNAGGRGGNGGNGEIGGNGGNGGNGGRDEICGAFHSNGGNGGDGANGANGGDGGNGGNGGNGGEVVIDYKSASGARINTKCLRSTAGSGGQGGHAGSGGQGGASGGRGAKPGKNGNPGENGKSGKNGLEGNLGEIKVTKN